MLDGQSRPGEGWGKSDEREQSRRSIYIFAKRSLAVPELELLDAPDTTSSCERRIVSTTGPQALTFLNGAFIHEQARSLRRAAGRRSRARARKTRWSGRSRWHWAGRPAPEESRAALEFLDKQERQIQADAAGTHKPAQSQVDARRKALEAFCLVVLNMNEFVYNN